MCSKYFHGREAGWRRILLRRMLALPQTGPDVAEPCVTQDLIVTLKSGKVEMVGRQPPDWRVHLRRHRARHDDRQAACSPARPSARRHVHVTYGDGLSDVDVGELVAFHKGPRQARDRHRGTPARTLRRARLDGDAVSASPRSRRPTRAGSTAASSSSSRRCSITSTGLRARSSATCSSACGGRAADGLPPPTVLPADGHAAREAAARGAVADRASRPGWCGPVIRTGASGYAGRRVFVDRPHGVQGHVALRLARTAARTRRVLRCRRRGRTCSAGGRGRGLDSRARRRARPRTVARSCAQRSRKSSFTSRRSRSCAPSYDAPLETFDDKRDGHRAAARGAARRCIGARGRGRHQRQVLRERRPGASPIARTTRWAATTPTARAKDAAELVTASYARSFLAACATRRRIAPARATSSAAATGPRTGSCPTRCAPRQPGTAAIRSAARAGAAVAARARAARRISSARASRRRARGKGSPGPWNFGPTVNDGVSVGDLVARLQRRWPRVRWNVRRCRRAPTRRRFCGWTARKRAWAGALPLSSRQTLDFTVAWYREARNPRAARSRRAGSSTNTSAAGQPGGHLGNKSEPSRRAM